MAYLEHEKVIHRDLAARNILVEKKNDKYTAKVADFGMSRITDKGEYISSDARLPIRWSAPEVLRREAASSKSDVWSFGVLLWEIFEWGAEPYGWMSNREVYEEVLEGNMLEPSKKMPILIAELMKQCMQMVPNARPTFVQVVETLKSNRKKIIEDTLKKESAIVNEPAHEAIPVSPYVSAPLPEDTSAIKDPNIIRPEEGTYAKTPIKKAASGDTESDSRTTYGSMEAKPK